MKIKIEGSIYFDPDSMKYGGGIIPAYRFCDSTKDNFCDYVRVVPHTLEVEIPDDFDPRPGMVEKLREKRKQAHADFAAMVMKIDQEINSLLAIENAA